MMDITIRNCNNIENGTIHIQEGRLNLKYAINGTGKSTIAKAIAATVNNDKREMQALTPFKFVNDAENHPAVVDGIDEAMKHIAEHGSGHTDGIITQSDSLAKKFTANVDSASVLVNASTRLSGGGDYGLGAVVGISTDRLHARGPVGPAELCTYKWVAVGHGNLRS